MTSRTAFIGASFLCAILAPKEGVPPPCQAATRVPLEPVAYRFDVDEIGVRSRGRVLLKDDFERPGTFRPSAQHPYFQNMGLLDGSDVRDGVLRMEESCSVNPFENFACDFSVPLDERGIYSFIGGEYFGDFELSAKLSRPRIRGPEKFKLGLVDDHVFFSAATVSFEKHRVTLERQGGEPRTVTPFLETTFDEVDLTRFGDLDELELRLIIDASGKPSGTATVRAGTAIEVVRLTASAPWARLNPRGRYSVHVFTEDLAKPRIFSFYPETVSLDQIRSNGGVLDTKIFGIGFGKDSVVELLPTGGGDPIRVNGADILMFNMGLRTTIALPNAKAGAYTVRVHSSGSTALLEQGLRVFE
jgi:hypothetical protein